MRKLIFYLAGAALLIAGYLKFSGSIFDREHFSNYPIGKTFTVSFSFPDLALEEFSDREKADQAKDWLLFSLLTNSGLVRQEVAEASFDLAPVRYGFNSTLANFEYGDTRCKFIGDGEVLALIPVSDDQARKDNLAHILDEIRKNQGEKPKKAFVFQYDLNVEGKFSQVTRLENADVAAFFSEKMGYFEMPVHSLDALESFMDKTDDITYAKRDDGNLILGGRKISSQNYGKATPEDVAAIWQSEKNIQERKGAQDNKFNHLETELKAEQKRLLEEYNVKIQRLVFEDGRTFSSLSADKQNTIINLVGKAINGISSSNNSYDSYSRYLSDENLIRFIAKMTAELAAIEERYRAIALQMGETLRKEPFASASGFSLDPDVDFEKSIAFVQKEKDLFEKALKPEFSVGQLIDNLNQKQGDLMIYAISNISKKLGESLVAEDARKTCTYQKARYDGDLQGTEVGMTLFYTDLLAKIWTENGFRSKPIDFIIGFKDHEQSFVFAPRVFDKESQALSAVRLWFGPNKNGFQSGENKTELTFARNATQIFALSNDPSSVEGITADGKSKNLEKQASAHFDVALSWWNNHYEEVGRFEQQYERLNEIMKWSTIISWMNVENSGDLLSFLAKYPVNRNLWFPDWAKSNNALKFSAWEKVSFYPRDHLENKTEAIPILFSPLHIIFGGVSLAESSLLREAPELLSSRYALFRRGNMKMEVIEGEKRFTTFKDTKLKFVENLEAKASRINFTPKEGYKLRNRFGEVANTKFEWSLTEESGGGFMLRSKMGETPIGELHSFANGKNGFSIGFESQAVDKGMAIARQISDFKGEPTAFLREHPEVVRYFQAESGEWCVQVKKAEEWMVMHLDTKPLANLSEGWQARSSGYQQTSKIVEVKWVNEAEVKLLAKNRELPYSTKLKNPLDESSEALSRRLVESKGKDGAATELASIREKGIADAEEFAAKGEFQKASAQVEKVIQHFGETAELAAKRVRFELQAGLKAIENSNMNTAANYFNEALTSRPSSVSSSDFLKEVNTLIDNSKVPPEMKAEIKTMADMYFTDREMFVTGFWEGLKPLSKQVPFESLAKKGSKVIYADNAAFSNIDPTAPFETIMGQVRSIPGVKVYDISAESIGRNTRFYATMEAKPSADYFNLPTQQIRFKVLPGSGLNNCIDRDNDGKCDDLYTVPGPVYYVTAPSAN